MKIPENYFNKTYAGWLGKIIGIRLGAAIEGWTYEKIENIYGELHDYPVDFKDFAADDDSNGPLFFLRALEDCKKSNDNYNITPQDVGNALLNYASFEQGFFWWGGYGTSTEHTAYLNLRNGIKAPRSGSIEQNGKAIAEQIGGQIFIDTWGLVCPGNPEQAAKYAQAAASVTHDGNGIYGGIFIACAISIAYIEKDIEKIINKALKFIPSDCEYTRVVNAVLNYYHSNPTNWRECYKFIFDNFGYDKYPGACHIIPNTAVIILSLLYGDGDFSNSINICNMCGWDTDCNVANVGTIMGVRGGLDCIDYKKWRQPINDFLACSSVIGSLNIMDLPYGVSYIAKLAYDVAGEELPEPLKDIINNRIDSCHFEYEGSTHAMRVRMDEVDNRTPETMILNSDETAATGSRSLKMIAKSLQADQNVYLFKKTYYEPKDFHDSRYDPSFSPLLYPGQTVHGSVFLPEYINNCFVQLYVREARTKEIIKGEKILLNNNEWKNLEFKIPPMEGALLDEAGFVFSISEDIPFFGTDFVAYVDDLYFDGKPNYTIDFSKETTEVWNLMHREVSQFTKLKGIMYLEDSELNLSCCDFAEAYTGRYDWDNYTCEFILVPQVGENHYVNFRVQGAIRSYAVGFIGKNKFALLKNNNGYKILKEIEFNCELGKEYSIKANVEDNKIIVFINDNKVFEFCDNNKPYLNGSIGVSVHKGSHCKFRKIIVK